MKICKLNLTKFVVAAVVLFTTPLMAQTENTGLINFGNLIETPKLDENKQPVLDENGNEVMRPLTNEEVIAKVKAVIEPKLVFNKLGKIEVKETTVKVEIKDPSNVQVISSFEINRETGYITTDEEVMRRRNETTKAIMNSLERKQKLHNRLQKAIDKIKEAKEQRAKEEEEAKKAKETKK